MTRQYLIFKTWPQYILFRIGPQYTLDRIVPQYLFWRSSPQYSCDRTVSLLQDSTYFSEQVPSTSWNMVFLFCLFVCLFVWSFSYNSRIFYSFGDVTIAGEGLQILTYSLAIMAIEQWGFFSMPHLLWHGTSVYNGHLRGPVTHLLLSVWQWSCHIVFLRLMSVAAGIWTPNLPLTGPTR